MKKKHLLLSFFVLCFALSAFANSGIYLRGGVNSWAAVTDWEFTDEGNGVYTLSDKEIYGQFKIADSSWGDCDYGSSGGTLSLGETLNLTAKGGNISCPETFQCSKITFTRFDDGSATLLLEGSIGSDDVITEVYIIGNNNNWDFNDTSGKLSATNNENEFKGTVTLGAASGENVCYWRIYERLGMSGSWGNPGGENTTGHKTSGTLERNSEGCVTTNPGTYIITFNLNTGAYSCENIPSVASGYEIMPQQAVLVKNVPEQVKVLSLNNSLIDYNDQNLMFDEICINRNKNASWTKHTLLGKSLLTHYNEGEGLTAEGVASAKMMVRSEAWSHIILQEQSATPRTNLKEFRESVRLWKEYIREYCPNPNAIIILPMNWAYNDWDSFKGNNKILLDSYMTVAQEQGVVICPVGMAYEAILDAEGSEACELLYSDNRHPTPRASYLAACMEYQLIFNELATDINYHPESITADEAESMRKYATTTVSSFICPTDHHTGKLQLSINVVDQFGIVMESVNNVTWTLSGGGVLNDKLQFTSDGTHGEFTVTASNADFTRTITFVVGDAVDKKKDEPVIEIDGDKKVIYEDFDGIGVEATATLPEGWRIDKQLSAPRTVGTFGTAVEVTEQTGGNSIASNAKNGIWNFGAGDAAIATDRAIGGISTGVDNGTRCINVYLHIRNTGSSTIDKLDISYDIEKYRQGNNVAGFAAQLYYSPDGVAWTSAGEDFYTFFAQDAATQGYSEAPGDSKKVEGALNYSVEVGKDIYLAWNLSVASGTAANGAQALALDNVRISIDDKDTKIEPLENSREDLNYYIEDGHFKLIGTIADKILIYDMQGILQRNENQTWEANLKQMSSGVYFVKVINKNKTDTVKIIIK